MPHPRLGILVVGAVDWAQTMGHLSALASLPEVELVGVVDDNDQALEAVRKRHGCAAYTDLRKALARDDAHMVYICSRASAHAEHAISAARSGKHILCEPPIALSIADALAIRENVRRARVKYMVSQNMRFQPGWRSLYHAIGEGKIGHPVFARYYTRGASYPCALNSCHCPPHVRPQPIANTMNHLDTVAWFMGARPTWVYAQRLQHQSANNLVARHDYWTIQVGFENGSLGHLEINSILPISWPPGHETTCMVIGSEGTIFASSTTEALVERWNAQRASFEPLPPAGPDGGLAAEIAHFAHAVLNDGEPDIELDWSIRVLEACLALEKSFREGRRLQLTQPA